MKFVGIDLHKAFLVVAVEDGQGPVGKPKRLSCRDEDVIVEHFKSLVPFQAVIEASCSYRWLYERLSPWGEVVLAHPYRLRAIVSARAKTDKLDAALLARLLRADLIPPAYIPPEPIQHLRDLTRGRARLSYAATRAKNQLRGLLRSRNLHPPCRTLWSRAGRQWLGELDLGPGSNPVRDELLRRLEHFKGELSALDQTLDAQAQAFPQAAALTDLHGIGLYSALLIVAEIGEPERFRRARQVGSYAGLTARVNQSGGHCYHGSITKQGSRWLRWVLVQAAVKIVRKDVGLRRFYDRIRKRSGRNRARVAVARKLAEICWLRLRRWHALHGSRPTGTR